MDVTLNVIFLIGAAFVLVKSTELLMGALKNLARVTKLGQFGVTAFLLALATSLPELTVGVVASLEGKSALTLGNVLGSNIADLSLVIGGAALVGGGFKVVGEFLRRDLFLTFFAGSLPLLLLVDGQLSRFDGVVLLVVYVVYVITVLGEKSKQAEKAQMKDEGIKRFFTMAYKNHAERYLGRFVLGATLLVLSSHVIVVLAEKIALGMGISILLVGLFLVAIGTSLPELVFEIKAIKARNIDMALGDLLGSVVANSTLVLGIASLITPMKLNGGLQPYLFATMGFVAIFLLFWLFVATKKKLEKWEGVVLLLLYVVFLVVELMRV